jgi:release factor glutamine methyltransferase
MPDARPVPLRLAINQAVTDLSQAGVESPRVDAELLAAHVLGVQRTRLVHFAILTGDQAREFRQLVQARAARVPLQHLTGTAPFRRFEVAVGPGVFIPRPETELLVDWALAAEPDAAVVVDLCSGSGAIALAVAHERPAATVYAVERSPEALEWLRRNASERAEAGDRAIQVVDGDATDPAVLSTVDGTVDLVLANPPYVPAGADVATEVRGHDPYEAVFGGADGLSVIRGIVARTALLLRPGGRVGIEHDDSHGEAVPALLGGDGHFTAVRLHHDLAGRPRFTTATRQGARLSG